MDTFLKRLGSFDAKERMSALSGLVRGIRQGNIRRDGNARGWLNCHLHTFHSFNFRHWSPSRIVFEGWRTGLEVVGTVDFDTLAGLEETLAAGRALGVPAMGGFESRVFVPEYRDVVLNSPKEPGIYYLCGKGFRTEPVSRDAEFFSRLKETAQARNRAVIEKLNDFLSEFALDYEKDLLPMTPSGNPTERHIVEAYQKVSERVLGDRVDAFWSGVLGLPVEETGRLRVRAPQDFQERLRSGLIKYGGPGYIPPRPENFPRLEDVVEATRDAGGIPVGTWLDGTSDGEKDPDQFLNFFHSRNVRAMTIIPERNWNIRDPAEKQRKTENLAAFLSACRKRNMPVICGTEMNKAGQPFVDDFSQPELKPYLAWFLESARQLTAGQGDIR